MPLWNMHGVAVNRPAILAAALALACGCARRPDDRYVAWLVLDTKAIDTADFANSAKVRNIANIANREASLSLNPPDGALRIERSGAQIVVAVDSRRRSGEMRIDVAGACPLIVARSELTAGATVRRTLLPIVTLRLPTHPRDIGYGVPFRIDAIPACPMEAGTSVVWRQTAGPPLHDVHSGDLSFEARLASATETSLEVQPWGTVPVSPRTSAEVEIEVEWRRSMQGAGAAIVRQRARLAAASRSRGLSAVAVDSGILLSGSGWAVVTSPPGAREAVHEGSRLARLIPDVAGLWVLRDSSGKTLSIRAGRYDETPLDCGRSGCHAAIAQASERSPMTLALRSYVDAPRDATRDPTCMLACHATGEPGTHDGGFTDVARELAGFGPRLGEWAQLPRALRRLGGVTCLACHGPSAIPETTSRWAILRADVCATCHDAPPTYGHVAAWRSSRMARSDADVRTRSDSQCARCHTTAGFLGQPARAAPPEVGPVGIACAACHAVHDTSPGPGHESEGTLLRDVPLPAAFDDASIPNVSRVCVPCHAPDSQSPFASAAALWAGRGGIDPDTGAALAGPSVHRAVERGCLGCHRTGPAGVERGRGHAFKADEVTCAGCHSFAAADTPAAERAIASDAQQLADKLVGLGVLGPPPHFDRPHHAAGRKLAPDRLGRAAYNVMLVLEDPAAAVHNAPYARALLDAARKVIP